MQQSTIEKHKHLLIIGDHKTKAEYMEAAAKFTNACCWDEQATYRMIALDGPDACFNPQQGVVCDRVCNMHSGDTYDMVINSGMAMQTPGFNKTGQRVDKNQQVMPYAYDESQPPANAGAQWPPYPGDQTFDVIGQALFDDYAEAKTEPNPGMSRWFGRCDYDTLTGVVADATAAVNKHRPDWRAELGLPPKASSVG